LATKSVAGNMALLTKDDVAELFGMNRRELSVYISRGLKKSALHLTGELIDDSDPVNKAWLDKYSSKRAAKTPKPAEDQPVTGKKPEKPGLEALEKAPSAPEVPGSTSKKEGKKASKSGNGSDYYGAEAEKTIEQTEKIRLEQEKLRIQIRKWRGEVLPTDVIKPLVLQHNHSILTESKNTIAEIVRLISKKKSLTAAERTEITTHYITALNDMMKKATQATIKSLTNIINEYSESRNVGERT
jgi:hypothetical protein